MKLSVIIPVYNEQRTISQCIVSLQKQDYKDFEILIIDDGSTDNTATYASIFPVRYFKVKHNGPGAARNFGATKAKGKILIFVDADMTFESNYLTELVKPIIKGEAIGTSHLRERIGNPRSLWVFRKDFDNTGVIYRAILKSKFTPFDSSLGYSDDKTPYRRLGKSTLVDSAICYHYEPDTLKEIFNHYQWVAGGASFDKTKFFLSLPFLPLVILGKTVSRTWKTILFYPIYKLVVYAGLLVGLVKRWT